MTTRLPRPPFALAAALAERRELRLRAASEPDARSVPESDTKSSSGFRLRQQSAYESQ